MKKILNFRPLLFLATFISLSVLSAYFISETKSFLRILIPILSIIILILFSIIFSKNNTLKRNLIFALVTIVLCALAFTNFTIRINNYKGNNVNGHVKTVSGNICLILEEDYGAKLCLSDIKFNGKSNPYKAIVYVYGEIIAELGDNVKFTTSVLDFSTEYENRFSSTYISEGIKYYCTENNYNVSVEKGSKNLFESVNLSIKNALSKGLGEREFSVAYAMLTGTSDYIDSTTLEGFRATGIAHIFAVSGLHAGFLAGALRFLFKKLKIKTKIRAPLTVALLIFYAGVCGFTASVIRATVMTSVFLLSELSGKKYDPLSSLSLSAIIILFINPFQLFCIGFQLSFSVVLGILLLSPVISKLFKFMPTKFAKALSSVVASFLSSFFICIAVFKKASIISVVANLIFIPISGILFVFLLISTIFAIIFSPKICLFIANYFLKLVITVIRSLDASVLMVGGIYTGGFIAVYYLALLISTKIINLKAKLKGIICSILSVIFVVGTAFTTIERVNAVEICVNYSQSFSSTFITYKSKGVLIVSNYSDSPNIYRLTKETENANVENIDSLIILNGTESEDLNLLISRLITKIKLNNVYTFNSENEKDFSLLENSFKNLTFDYVEENQILNLGFLDIENCSNGYFAKGKANGKAISVFSNVDSVNVDFSKTYNSNLIIALDKQDQIKAKCPNSTLISYKYSSVFANAEVNGNYKIKINKKGQFK
ncbi:MAG: ComEC/Rec2 family competence protein [Clostridia bacterium]|nr:ComEC/Rec2 family competence protein [Clostridia bacterium]